MVTIRAIAIVRRAIFILHGRNKAKFIVVALRARKIDNYCNSNSWTINNYIGSIKEKLYNLNFF